LFKADSTVITSPAAAPIARPPEPVGAADAAGLFGKNGRGQHCVGEIRGPGEDEILHRQVLKLRRRIDA